jgi:hypothetical protein
MPLSVLRSIMIGPSVDLEQREPSIVLSQQATVDCADQLPASGGAKVGECNSATKCSNRAGNVRGNQGLEKMADQINPKFHAEIIVVLFDEYQDLRKVTDRVGILLSDASAEHIECWQVFADRSDAGAST